eukprot:m.831939 g.831939  ORF g.831939 m.831939 type:complete len:508 (-) comp23430_c1_seq7:295-1818(-)
MVGQERLTRTRTIMARTQYMRARSRCRSVTLNTRNYCALWVLLYSLLPVMTGASLDDAVDTSTLRQKVLFGYQGWFDTPSSGSGADKWVHWSPGDPPNATFATFDIWPSMSEYPPAVQDGTPALISRKAPHTPLSLFSSFPKETTDIHFRWMREYGIDGVFVQRFVNGLENGPNSFKDNITLNAVAAAEVNGRGISIMYDISGADEDKWASTILADWRRLVTVYKVTESTSWLHHNGHPVLAIWGMGFTGHPGTPASSLALIHSLREMTPITLVGGIPTHWRSNDGDSKPGYSQVYAAMDVLSPWLVGRFTDDDGFDNYMKSTFDADKVKIDALGKGYAPVVWPGFSWYNLQQRTHNSKAIFNQIPRRGGAFWQHQADGFLGMKTEPLFIYGAMFDEVDEGTAMFKCASVLEDTPEAPAKFVYLSIDGETIPEDFYLSLAGNFTAKWRNSTGSSRLRDQGQRNRADTGSGSRRAVVPHEDSLASAKEHARVVAAAELAARKFLLGLH